MFSIRTNLLFLILLAMHRPRDAELQFTSWKSEASVHRIESNAPLLVWRSLDNRLIGSGNTKHCIQAKITNFALYTQLNVFAGKGAESASRTHIAKNECTGNTWPAALTLYLR